MEVSDQLHDALLFAQARTQNFSFLVGAGVWGGGGEWLTMRLRKL